MPQHSLSHFGIFTYIWLILMVNVGNIYIYIPVPWMLYGSSPSPWCPTFNPNGLSESSWTYAVKTAAEIENSFGFTIYAPWCMEYLPFTINLKPTLDQYSDLREHLTWLLGHQLCSFWKIQKLCGTKQHPTTEIGLTECIPHNSEMRFFQRTRCHTKIQISKMEVHNTWVRGDPPPKQPEKVLRLLGDHPHSVSSW